jgi:tRNA (guanine-N7-)-methyltransferase
MNQRRIRSFVLRQGRLSGPQKRAIEEKSTQYCIDINAGLYQFPKRQPLVLEIGFGMGDSLACMAAAAPELNFLGAEVHQPGIGHLIIEAERLGLENLRIVTQDAVDVLHSIEESSLEKLQVFFPDPWPKKRHHKRRLINRSFLDLAVAVLRDGGVLHIATDWQGYADEILSLTEQEPRLTRVIPPERPQTKYEARGLRLGHEVNDIALSVHK